MGRTSLPGLSLASARQVPPPYGLAQQGTVLAVSNYAGTTQPLVLSRAARYRHLYVVGPTGVGKSTLLANLIVRDIARGDGLALIDPKGDLVTDVLAHIPNIASTILLCSTLRIPRSQSA